MDARVTILNPWDSQGNQITDGAGIYPCLRGCGGAGYQQGYVLQHMEKQEENQMDCGVILAFKERAGKPGGGKGILIGEDKSFTLSTLQDEAICYAVQSHPIVCYDSRGNGDGVVRPTMTGDHENRITDYTSVVVIDNSRGHK